RPEGEVRQPGADARPIADNAPPHPTAEMADKFPSRPFRSAASIGTGKRRSEQAKEDPGARRGQGLFAGWVRGWGLGGTPPGVGCSTPRPAAGSGTMKLFFGPCLSDA